MDRNVFVTRVIPQAGIDLLRRRAQVTVNEQDTPLDHDALKAQASANNALVTLLTDRIDRDILEAGRNTLRIIANVAVGYDNIDVDAATELGIAVTNTPDVLTETTADFAWALLMSVARRVCEGQSFLRSGQFHGWGIMMLLGGDVYGKTLGVVGFGRIGRAVARRASGFNMPILYYDPVLPPGAEPDDPSMKRVDLDTLLGESDFVSIHTPLTPQTHHLIGTEQLRLMRKTAYLINTARGPVIDEAALAAALSAGEIAGAGLDVFEREPEVDPGLLALPNVVLTPHIASASTETRSRMATVAAQNVLDLFDGLRPPQILNPTALERSGS